MMEDYADDDAGEISAAKSQFQPVKCWEQDIASPEACGHCPQHDWCHACVGGAGRSDAHNRRQEEQHAMSVESLH